MFWRGTSPIYDQYSELMSKENNFKENSNSIDIYRKAISCDYLKNKKIKEF